MKSPALLFLAALLPVMASRSGAANIAGQGTGLLGSNDATITDTGSSHSNAGTPANIRDGDLLTRVDNFQSGQPGNINGYAGVSWTTARTDMVKSMTLTMATFVDGGWFGNREAPRAGFPLTGEMLVAPVVQVSTNLTVWTTVPAAMDYVSAFTGHVIAVNNAPTARAFTITLPQAQTGIRGIRVIGPTGGWGDGNGFIGVYELAVEAEAIADSEPDGMDDAWEAAHGLAVGTNDAGLDADNDGLTNAGEFRWGTDPQNTDSDGDSLTDGAEDAVHFTWPNATDTDGDGLSDAAEINTHLTNPRLPDSDSDGLSDAAEVITQGTLPLDRDTDDDGFGDGAEISLGTNPLAASSRSANIARAGTPIMGRNTTNSAANLAVTGTARANANTNASLTDGDLYTRADTAGMTGTASHAGVVWSAAWPQPVARLEITFATFADGGWIGNGSFNPSPGAPLTASHINAAPVLQTTADGSTWTTVPAGNYTTDYITRLTGHSIGGGPRPEATRRAAIFTLNTPAAGLRGIRIAGLHRNYLGVYEIAVCDSSTAGDTDGDGLSNAAEAVAGTSPLYSDTDEDTAGDAAESVTLLTNPLVADTDGDLFPDGLEVRQNTNPGSAGSRPQNLSLIGGGIIGVNDAADGDSGTATANAGVPGNLTDGDAVTRVDSWNNNGAGTHSYIGARWPTAVQAAAVRVEFATFNHAGWFGPAGTGPAAGGALTSAHLTAPMVQTTNDGGTTWNTVGASSDYVAQLTGHVIAGADNRPTRTPVVTFTLTNPATGINGIRLIGVEGGVSAPFVGAFDFTVVPSTAAPATSVSLTWVPVGNPGNPAHPSGYGAVPYAYSISAHEVTIAQYCAFLNAVAAGDPHELYAPEMGTSLQVRGIFRTGASGAYSYHIIGDGSRPMAWINWQSAARFVNWLQNGQGSGSTETGVYDMTVPSHISVAQVRAPGSVYALPSANEWFKAAYYDPAKSGGAGGYWKYAIRSDTLVNNTVSANYFDGDYAATQSPFQTGESHLLPVGFFSAAPGAYGTYDQTGSVWEWVELDSGSPRMQMGGGWTDDPALSEYLSAGFPLYRSPEERFATSGFRVVKCPPAPALFGSLPAGGQTVAVAADSSGGANPYPDPAFPAVGGPGFPGSNVVHTEVKSFAPGSGSLSYAEVNTPVTNGAFSGNAFSWGRAAGVMGTSSVRAFSSKPRFTLAPGLANAGWSDTWQISAPGLQGQSGWVKCSVSVTGNLTASGANGSASLEVRPLVTGLVIPNTGPGANPGSGSFAVSGQHVVWSYRSDVPPPLNIATTVTFSIPFTFGQQFRLSLYSLAAAASAGTTNSADIVTGEANGLIKWNGITGVLDAAQLPVTGYTVLSASGVPWSGSIPPQCLMPAEIGGISPSGNAFQVTWPTLAGVMYRVEKSADLQTWMGIGPSIPGSGAPATTLFTPEPSETRLFFRVCEEL